MVNVLYSSAVPFNTVAVRQDEGKQKEPKILASFEMRARRFGTGVGQPAPLTIVDPLVEIIFKKPNVGGVSEQWMMVLRRERVAV